MARRLGVVGHPIAHSLSPALHRAAYRVLGLPWEYGATDLVPGSLRSFTAGLDETWRGLSVTMPHKLDALEISDSVDLLARLTGSVNTLVFHHDPRGNRKIEGFNTDVAGIVGALAQEGIHAAPEVAIVGGGATASSAVVAAAELGAERITVLVRDVVRAEHLLAVGEATGVALRIHDVEQMPSLDPVNLVISTIPGTAPLSLGPLSRVPSAALLDVAYSPWPSVRGQEWSRTTAGNPVIVSGLAMLAAQALVQVRLFFSGDSAAELPNESDVRTAMHSAIDLP